MVNWILLILAVVLGFYIYQKNNNKPWKLLLGGLLIIVGILIVSPIPDPSDTIGFATFSMVKGIDLNMDNFSTYFLEYLLLTFIMGGLMVYTGMRLLGWNFKRLWKKLDIGKYKIAIGLAILAVLAVAVWDIWSMNSGIFGNVIEYTSGNYLEGWWDLFLKFVLVLFLAVPISYYFLVHKDKSETFGIFIFSIILYFGGLADIFYFLFQKVPIPSELPWLLGSPFISFVSTNLLGYSTVTNISLLVSVILSFIIAWGFAWVMKEKF